MILWASITVCILWTFHTRAEVVSSFQSCPQFFYRGREPEGFDQNATRICQKMTADGQFSFATLYSASHRVPVFSAYTFHYHCEVSPEQRRSGGSFIEPQLSDPTYPVYMDEERNHNLESIKARQAITEDYSESSYDRGHLKPSSFQCNKGHSATSTLTNSAPMDPTFSRVSWRRWEHLVRVILESQSPSGTAYLVTGTVLGNTQILKQVSSRRTEEDLNRVTVPSHVWTAVCYVHPTDPEESFSFGVFGENKADGGIFLISMLELTQTLRQLHDSKLLKIFADDCFLTEPKSEETIKMLKHQLSQQQRNPITSPDEKMFLNSVATRTSHPAAKVQETESNVELVYTDEYTWLMGQEDIKALTGLACSLSAPCSVHEEPRRRKRQASEGTVCKLVSEKTNKCVSPCFYDEKTAGYFCSTNTSTMPCTPTYSDVTIRGVKCRTDHTCGKHGYNYYWCYTDDSWDYCSPPQPLGLTVNGKRCSVQRNCAAYGYDYYWCRTDDGYWDFCCPKADCFTALNVVDIVA
ncbi:Endonuclease domain-containing 1 protein [Oryzias melastigma]|uniref:Endonuclease domain-containing 1 protein n=1 Tax=Oryzias melastigma TaxID=30732 RepID=A0A834FPF3_ORYME|nr:Endonuclease domain-containing 1 protein [Oryzias melastigma]